MSTYIQAFFEIIALFSVTIFASTTCWECSHQRQC